MRNSAGPAVPVKRLLPALLVLAWAATPGLAADSARPAPATPLQVTYYYLPG
jgi:hypothetical protein